MDASTWELLPADHQARDEIRTELGADGRRVVGLFGELKFKKRVPLWLAALRDAGLVDRVGLLVVGRTDEETRQLLDDPVLAPLHRRISFRRRENLPGLYAACDFIALPSLFEGMPNVLLEAMAAGVVPIASDAGALGEVVVDGETGFLFPAEDRTAAAEATARALAMSNEELAAMAQRVRAHATTNFSVERELDVLTEMISAARGDSPGGQDAQRVGFPRRDPEVSGRGGVLACPTTRERMRQAGSPSPRGRLHPS